LTAVSSVLYIYPSTAFSIIESISLYTFQPLFLQTDVSYEDQQKINTFSRLNLRMNDLEARLTARRRAAEDYEEAGNEIMLLDDETVPFVVGECLAHLPREDVEERLQKCKQRREPPTLFFITYPLFHCLFCLIGYRFL
jgi:hypothetical protein